MNNKDIAQLMGAIHVNAQDISEHLDEVCAIVEDHMPSRSSLDSINEQVAECAYKLRDIYNIAENIKTTLDPKPKKLKDEFIEFGGLVLTPYGPVDVKVDVKSEGLSIEDIIKQITAKSHAAIKTSIDRNLRLKVLKITV